MRTHIDRRECLQLAAAAILGVSIRGADRPAKRMTFGFSLYGMRTLSLEAGLMVCARIGYDAVELPLMPGWPAESAKLNKDDRKKLRERLAELKLSLPALMENLPLDVDDKSHQAQLDRLQAAADLANELAPGQPPIIETILGGKPGQWDKLRDTFAKRLDDWARIAEASKVIVAIKPHRMGAMNLPEHALWLIEKANSPWIRVAYDWSHYEQRDLTMRDTLHALIPFTCFVHVKDTVIVKDKTVFVLPGEGTTDYVQLLKGLKDESYAGCVCVEVSGMVSAKKDYDPLVAAKKCHEKLSPAFAETKTR